MTDIDGTVRCDIPRLEHPNVEALDYFSQIGEMPRARNVTRPKEDYKNI